MSEIISHARVSKISIKIQPSNLLTLGEYLPYKLIADFHKRIEKVHVECSSCCFNIYTFLFVKSEFFVETVFVLF